MNKNPIIFITLSNKSMVSELINEYFRKTNTNRGRFNFNGIFLLPTDKRTLNEVGLYNFAEIIVS